MNGQIVPAELLEEAPSNPEKVEVVRSPSRAIRKSVRHGYKQRPRGVPIVNGRLHIHRNDPCPCGSGKKFKACHGLNRGNA